MSSMAASARKSQNISLSERVNDLLDEDDDQRLETSGIDHHLVMLVVAGIQSSLAASEKIICLRISSFKQGAETSLTAFLVLCCQKDGVEA